MTRKARIALGIGIIVAGTFIALMYRKQVRFHESIKQHQVGYAYEIHPKSGVINSAMLLEEREKMPEYIAYYKRVLEGENPVIPFSIKTLSFDSVYIVGYAADSSLVEVVSYYDYGNLRGGAYTRGWVYRPLLHDIPPPRKSVPKR